MNINFIPTFFYDPMTDAGGVGANPYAAAAQGVIGGIQAIGGAITQKKYTKKLEGLIAGYKPNAGIMDYYNKALARYSSNPYTSSLYNQQTKNINRNINAGISALQDKRLALGGISSLVQGGNDASLKAATNAEQLQGQQLSQLGGAAQSAAQEQYKPFEMKYNLYAAKAGGGAANLGAGLQNIVGSAGGIQDYQNLNSMYGRRRSSTPNYLSYGQGE